MWLTVVEVFKEFGWRCNVCSVRKGKADDASCPSGVCLSYFFWWAANEVTAVQCVCGGQASKDLCSVMPWMTIKTILIGILRELGKKVTSSEEKLLLVVTKPGNHLLLPSRRHVHLYTCVCKRS